MTNSLISSNFLATVNNITADVYLVGKTNLGAAVDFVSQQAPQVAQEYVAWHMIDNGVSLACKLGTYFVFVAIGLFIAWKLSKSVGRETRECGVPMVFGFVLITSMAVAGPMCIESSKNIKEILKAKYSPRIVLIEKAAELVHGGKK